MSSSRRLKEPNRLIAEKQWLLNGLLAPTGLLILHLLSRRGPKKPDVIGEELSVPLSDVEQTLLPLLDAELVNVSDEIVALTPLGARLLNYGRMSPDSLVGTTIAPDHRANIPNALGSSYRVKEVIGRGATSFTYRAEHTATHRDRTLKVFLPGSITYPQLDLAVTRRAQINSDALPEIVDVGQIALPIYESAPETVPCVVLKYINNGAQTFAEFLSTQANLDQEIFEHFIRRVGGALAALESVGLTHGDLHERNILVAPNNTSMSQDFWVIDFVGVPWINSPEVDVASDIESFRDHLIRATVSATKRYPGVSARLLLGERAFRVLAGLRSGSYSSFRDILQDFDRPVGTVPSDYFKSPAPEPFEWLRVEWINSPRWLYRLFEPDQTRFQTISRFGNTWISGPRGSGKSHYLRVLAFQPEVLSTADSDPKLLQKLSDIGYDFRKAFGILFACRLGEFKGFVPEAMVNQKFDPETTAFLKRILVLKIWTKTLDLLREGLERRVEHTGATVLRAPHDVQPLRQFLEEKLGEITTLGDAGTLGVFRQCLAMCTAQETFAVAVWNHPSRRPRNLPQLGETELNDFFSVLKQTFPDLADARFFILVDDASYGNIHFEMQKILNSLVRAAQANHCFKITCDKFMYTLDTSDDRAIDPRHEVTYVDLGEVSTKTQRETTVDLSQYMARVVNSRLDAAGFTTRIETILGESQSPSVFLAGLAQPDARRSQGGTVRSRGRRGQRALYAGWNIVWNLSHGSVRTLLELVEHIFKSTNASRTTESISLADQDEAVRIYSQRQFRALSMLPGELNGEPVGQRVKSVLSALGEVSRQYIQRYDTGAPGRWYETISVERLDGSALDQVAQDTLIELIKYGALLDDGVTFARAQLGLSQRYDMNKVFAPGFRTTYRVRNHIYLRRPRFEELLLSPDLFLARHREKLDELANDGQGQRQPSLFDLSRE